MKLLACLALCVSVIVIATAVSVRAEEADTATSASKTVVAENVGNEICPVSGAKINQETKATYEYKGKIYNFCCPMCIEEFKKDPDKYIQKVEEELKGQTSGNETEATMPEMEGMHEEQQGQN